MNKSKKEHILNIASGLFNKQGIRATGVDQVVSESHIAKMTLYNHYESKDELVLAYLLRQDEQWRKWFSLSVNELSITPKGKLLAIFDVLGLWFKEPDFNGCAFIKTASEFSDHSHPYNEAAQKYKSYLKDFISDLVHQSNVKSEEDLTNGIYLLVEGAITIAMLQTDLSVALQGRKTAELLIERLV
ncbi:TetR/AcrR family transcriptional regulator [Paenibacillus psychroresistens]|uniref:TetR/AcrR family transcriptional regulator n=1 Tax=Paenibacillus psychroresistens TaxID=1778678 RepID=A0A6B8RU60_9BACL|nr:TetR/AcrR family transcriptional regulator [Paenibacillus psychroresistens]QGQ99135.1 TetR/AcrR family transcriptional regulator [Paenibacillus psychroresistens]